MTGVSSYGEDNYLNLFFKRLCQRLVDDVGCGAFGQGDAKTRFAFHGSGGLEFCAIISGPGATCDAVVHVPEQHRGQSLFGLFAAIEHEAEAAIDHFSPADASAVMQAHPRGAAEAIADHVVDGHIRAKCASVVDICRLAER